MIVNKVTLSVGSHFLLKFTSFYQFYLTDFRWKVTSPLFIPHRSTHKKTVWWCKTTTPVSKNHIEYMHAEVKKIACYYTQQMSDSKMLTCSWTIICHDCIAKHNQNVTDIVKLTKCETCYNLWLTNSANFSSWWWWNYKKVETHSSSKHRTYK